MTGCDFIDYSDRKGSLATVLTRRSVSLDDLAMVRESIPPEQRDQVEEGDAVTVYLLDNPVEDIKGTLTVWHDKGMAAIDTGSGTSWGDWDEEHMLLLTEEFEEERDPDGEMIMGRVAYNTHGIRGILFRGTFYTLLDQTS